MTAAEVKTLVFSSRAFLVPSVANNSEKAPILNSAPVPDWTKGALQRFGPDDIIKRVLVVDRPNHLFTPSSDGARIHSPG